MTAHVQGVDPVVHAREVMRAWMSHPDNSPNRWLVCGCRAELVRRVGAEVVAQAERTVGA